MRVLVRLFMGALLVVPFLFPAVGITASLRIGLLPAADSLLLIVAREEGLFAENDLDVELVPFMSSLEQGAALRAGELDGTFTDLVRVFLLNRSGTEQKVVATTFHTSTASRYFGLAASPRSGSVSLRDLKGGEVGISTSTIIAYVYDRMLAEQGLSEEHFRPLSIDKIPIRLQMLLSGRLAAAILPEPLLTLAEQRGAKVLWDDRKLDAALAVVALRTGVVEGPEGERIASAFRAALGEAAGRVNAEPEKYRVLMTEKRLLPSALVQTFAMLRFDPARVPGPLQGERDVNSYGEWMIRRGLLREMPDPAGVCR